MVEQANHVEIDTHDSNHPFQKEQQISFFDSNTASRYVFILGTYIDGTPYVTVLAVTEPFVAHSKGSDRRRSHNRHSERCLR